MSLSSDIDPTKQEVTASDADAALAAVGVPLSLAEAHGLACGLLCSQTSAAAKARWFTELLDAAELAAESLAAHGGSVRCLDAWFEATQEQLDAPDMAFEPALPSDETPLGVRIDALGDYCAGFTYGVGIGTSSRGNRPLPADTQELLTDFQAIDSVERGNTPVASPSGSADQKADSASEADYVELLEYVRVGVLVVLEELKPVERAGTPVALETDASKLH